MGGAFKAVGREEEDGTLLAELRSLRHRMDRLEERVEAALRGRPGPSEGRIPTGVEGLDDLLGGGLPAGHVVLLHGPPGTLKTSLALTVLARNEERAGRRLYLSLEEGRESLLRTMRGLGLPEEDFLVDLATMRLEHGLAEGGRDWLPILMSYLRHKMDAGLDLLAIDPLDALYPMTALPSPRQDLFQFFTFLREAGLTTLLVYEEPAFLHREDLLADGVLETEEREGADGRISLSIRCPKMRHTGHSRDRHRLELREGRLLVARAEAGASTRSGPSSGRS
jgi:circadian clock protein KaiC